MLQDLFRIRDESDFDFRNHANPQDPLRHLFPEWVDYYRTKSAIAQWLQPKSILEIGVRYGYSAISFLTALPKATYTGIDNDSEASGGVPGAIEWAKSITQGYEAQFILADTAQLQTLPGTHYDLVHVDGAQFGDSTYHDLELALQKSNHILLDGVFWSHINNQAAATFLKDYRAEIEYAIHIPGYAGELLIRTKSSKGVTVRDKPTSASIQEHYDTKYYLEDRGDYDNYAVDQGKILGDPRLHACVNLISPTSDKRILDVGCGRGEIAFACTTHGASVDAVDYSADAIALSKHTFSGTPESRLINLHQSDITNFQGWKSKYDAIIVADCVEHLSPDESKEFYAWASGQLAEHGQLIVHTSPNLWFYQYHYAKRRRAVEREGGFLPPDPRTDHEKLMQINGQSPKGLYHQLAQKFDHVLVWLASADDPVFSLKNKLSHRTAQICPSIYAIASNIAIDRTEIEQRFVQNHIDPSSLRHLTVDVDRSELCASPGEIILARIEVSNSTGQSLSSNPPYPVHLSYHIQRGKEILVFEGMRSRLPGAIRSGETVPAYLTIQAPIEPGKYQVDLTIVQEGVAWVDQIAPNSVAKIDLTVE